MNAHTTESTCLGERAQAYMHQHHPSSSRGKRQRCCTAAVATPAVHPHSKLVSLACCEVESYRRGRRSNAPTMQGSLGLTTTIGSRSRVVDCGSTTKSASSTVGLLYCTKIGERVRCYLTLLICPPVIVAVEWRVPYASMLQRGMLKFRGVLLLAIRQGERWFNGL